jgi:hypothetical protein
MTRDPDAPDPRDLDGDPLSGPVPAPDTPPDAAERTRARGFGDLVDKVLAGRAPAAVPAEDRALLEVASVIRAASRPVELPAARTSQLVEAALATAIDRKAGARPGDPARTTVPIVPITRSRRARVLPWAVAATTSAVAAAAIVVLVLRGPGAAEPPAAPRTAATELPAHQRSRPADPLIGAIARDRAGDAAARLDVIYADRMGGFRERTLSATRPRRSGATP